MPPYDGSGTFSAYTPGNPVVTGTTISSTAFNNTINDLCANGLSFAMTKDGQQTATANIPMGGFKFTGLGAGSSANDSARLAQIQGSGAILLNNVAGTNSITATMTPTLTAYASGQLFILKPAVTNTAATSITIDSIAGGAKNIFAFGAAALGGELIAGIPSLIEYDGTQFNIVGSPIITGTWTPSLSDGNGAHSATYSAQTGEYVKAGKLVIASFHIDVNSIGTLSGPLVIAGLPFTVKNSTGSRGSGALQWTNFNTALLYLMALAVENTTTATLYGAAGAVTTTSSITASDVHSGGAIDGCIVYKSSL